MGSDVGAVGRTTARERHNASVAAKRIPWRIWSLAAVIGLFALLAYLALGSVDLEWGVILRHLAAGPLSTGNSDNLIIWQIRLPRAIACACAGGSLGLIGAVYQAVFRNPLAEPYVIGVSSGAAVGGTAAVVAGLDFGLARAGLASAGALLSLLLVLALARRQGVVNIHTLLVGGVVVGAFLSGILTLCLWLAGFDTGKILWWLLGSTNPMFWDRTLLLLGTLLCAGVLLYRQARALNAFAVGEFMSERQGVEVGKLKRTVLAASSIVTGVVVGCVGIIGFVGLIAPHIARRLVGNDLRLSLPLSALTGTSLLLLADLLAQRIHPPMELPLGAVTALIGAPCLLWLLRKRG